MGCAKKAIFVKVYWGSRGVLGTFGAIELDYIRLMSLFLSIFFHFSHVKNEKKIEKGYLKNVGKNYTY